MNDDRQIQVGRKLQFLSENFFLLGLFGKIVVKIKADLTDGDNLGILWQVLLSSEICSGVISFA